MIEKTSWLIHRNQQCLTASNHLQSVVHHSISYVWITRLDYYILDKEEPMVCCDDIKEG